MSRANVIYHYEPEGWWAESPEVPEWSAAAESFEELKALAEEGVRFATDSPDWDFVHVLASPWHEYFQQVTVGALVRVSLAASRLVAEPADVPGSPEHTALA